MLVPAPGKTWPKTQTVHRRSVRQQLHRATTQEHILLRRVVLTRQFATRSHVAASTVTSLERRRSWLHHGVHENHPASEHTPSVTSETHKSRAFKLLPNLAEGAGKSAKPRLHPSKTCKSRAFELSPNLAEGADETARPHLHHSKCKSRAFKLLPNLAQRADESTRPRLHHSNMQTLGPCQSLAEGADESARPRLHRSKACKSRALRLMPTLQREPKSQQDHVHIIKTCKTSGPMPNLAEGTESQQDHDYIIQDMQKQELLGSCQNLAKGANESAKPRLKIKHATTWALAKTLLRER